MKPSTELTRAVVAHCDASTLAALSSTSKLLHFLTMPLLHARVRLSSPEAWRRYDRTMRGWVNPFVRKHVSEKKVEMYDVDELILEIPNDATTATTLPDLSYLSTANLFSTLTHLTIRNILLPDHFIVTLLGPGRPARATVKHLELCQFPRSGGRDDPSTALAFLLQMMEALPTQYYVIGEQHLVQDTDVESQDWKELSAMARWWEKKPKTPPAASSAPPTSSASDADANADSDSDDEDEDYAPSEMLRHLCHSSEHSIVAFSKEGTREHGEHTQTSLEYLSSNPPSLKAFSLFQHLLRLPGRRICSSCLDLPNFLVSAPPSSSPFKHLTHLEWTLSFSGSHDEDLLILLGTDVVGGLEELKLRGKIKQLSHEVDLLIRASVASDPSCVGAILPPVGDSTPLPPAFVKSTTLPSRSDATVPPPTPLPVVEKKDSQATQTFAHPPSWLARLSTAEIEGEVIVQKYRGPRLRLLDAREVEVLVDE